MNSLRQGSGLALDVPVPAPTSLAAWREESEQAAVAELVRTVNAVAEGPDVPWGTRWRVLRAVTEFAGHLDLARSRAGEPTYGRRVLWEEPSGWSLAAITLKHGQATEVHDHNGWGCAVTVQGIERDRRFAIDESGELVLIEEHDYPAGAGYLFDMQDIHQPIGADPNQATVSLHFLFLDHSSSAFHQRLHEHRTSAIGSVSEPPEELDAA